MNTTTRILVADHDAAALQAMSRLLSQAGYEVLDASSGRQALQLAREHRPSLALLYVMLPDLSGPEVLATMRADPALESVTVVLLSSVKTKASDQAAGLDAGADGYIAWPISDEELLARVRLHLRQHELTDRLRISEQRYRDMVEHLPDLVFINRNERIIYVNSAGVRMLRAGSDADLLGRSPFELIHPDFHEQVRARIAAARAGPLASPLVEEQLVALDGTVIDVEVTAISFRSGEHMDIQVIARDITGRRQAEAERQALLAREQSARSEAVQASSYYRSLFESAPGCYLVMTPDEFEIVAVSEAYLHATRTRRDELSGRRLFDVLLDLPGNLGDVARNLRVSLDRVRQDRRADVMSVQLIPVRRPAAEGGGVEDRYWSPINSPVFGPRGELAYIIHRVEDVTEYLNYRLEFGEAVEAQQMLASRAELMEAEIVLRSREISQARRQLEESQALLRMASHLSRLGAWTVELPGKEVAWSEELFEIHQRPTTDVPDFDEFLGYYPPSCRGTIQAAFQACATQGVPYDLELQIITSKGRRRWVRSMAEAVRDGSGAIVRVQGALQDISELKAAEAREGALRKRLTAMLERIGEAFIALDRDWEITYVNREAERLVGQGRDQLVGRDLWSVFPDAQGTRFEAEYRRAMRDSVPVSLVEYFPPLEIWADARAYPSEEGLAIYFRDVTRERSLEDQVRQSQRLESLGQLTGGVAHDFNNLLTVILGNAELLHEQLESQAHLSPLAAMISSAAQRAAELTQALLAFARRQALEPRVVDVNDLVAGMRELLQRTLGENIQIEFQTAGSLKPALVDQAQLESALLNLCLNARDAMPDGGRLVIETAMCSLDTSYVDTNLDPVDGDYIMVAVSDTGTGIAAEHLPRVFEPFFTTKETGKGTGLGLSMVYGFVKQSGGQVKILSEPGQGTSVRMYLPLAAEGESVVVPAAIGDAMAGGAETILLVEDDDMVRRYAHDQLAALGYRVVVAENGPEAMDILRSRDDIELLFTDIVMPGGMNGRQLADAAREFRPGLKVLFTSGYSESAVVHHGRIDAGVQLLSKPYRRSELAARIRTAIDGP